MNVLLGTDLGTATPLTEPERLEIATSAPLAKCAMVATANATSLGAPFTASARAVSASALVVETYEGGTAKLLPFSLMITC